MLEYLKMYIIAMIAFLTLDMIWLLGVAKKLYAKELGFIMAPKANIPAAVVFYLIFILGLVVFVIKPSMDMGTWSYALFLGMFFGFVTYSTYDLTNLATLKDWPIRITVIDMMWGTSLGGLVSLITFSILNLGR